MALTIGRFIGIFMPFLVLVREIMVRSQKVFAKANRLASSPIDARRRVGASNVLIKDWRYFLDGNVGNVGHIQLFRGRK
jgi:hypothetical protein